MFAILTAYMPKKSLASSSIKICKACLSEIPLAARKCSHCGSSQGLSACLIILITLAVLFIILPMLIGFLIPLFTYYNLGENADELQNSSSESGEEVTQ